MAHHTPASLILLDSVCVANPLEVKALWFGVLDRAIKDAFNTGQGTNSKINRLDAIRYFRDNVTDLLDALGIEHDYFHGVMAQAHPTWYPHERARDKKPG